MIGRPISGGRAKGAGGHHRRLPGIHRVMGRPAACFQAQGDARPGARGGRRGSGATGRRVPRHAAPSGAGCASGQTSSTPCPRRPRPRPGACWPRSATPWGVAIRRCRQSRPYANGSVLTGPSGGQDRSPTSSSVLPFYDFPASTGSASGPPTRSSPPSPRCGSAPR
jgi:hypothetical protein